MKSHIRHIRPHLFTHAAALTLLLGLAFTGAIHAWTVATDGNVSGWMDVGGTSEDPAEYIIGVEAGYNYVTSGELHIGPTGSYTTLMIQNGAQVSNTSTTVAMLESAAYVSVVVKGTGTLWSQSGQFQIGVEGSHSSLTIKEGASVKSLEGYIGSEGSAAQTTVTISDAGSSWKVDSAFFLGYRSSSNSLTIEKGGGLTTGGAYVGWIGASDDNTALVTGAGSKWVNQGSITIGGIGSGNSLTIADGALVQTDLLTISSDSGAVDNFLRLDGGYLALQGDQVDDLTALITGGRVQLLVEGVWTTVTTADSFSITHFTNDTDAFDSTGYEDLGGYTVITSPQAIPEPGTWALLGMVAVVALPFLDRRFRRRKG